MVDVPVDLDLVRETLREFGIAFALLFGSWASGTAREESDVDLAVWSQDPVDDWGLRGALPSVIDLIDLRTAPDGLAGRIAMTGAVVLDDDPRARIRWQADNRKRYLDEEFRRRRFREDFVAAHG